MSRAISRGRVEPHRIESFKFSTDPELEAKIRDVVGLYLDPPANAASRHKPYLRSSERIRGQPMPELNDAGQDEHVLVLNPGSFLQDGTAFMQNAVAVRQKRHRYCCASSRCAPSSLCEGVDV